MLISGGLEIMTHKPIGRTPALRIKYTWVYLAIPLGGACMIVEIILRMYRRLKNLLRQSS
jgi:TRAP-type C4-dicarboxylate transport system permease small subunit